MGSKISDVSSEVISGESGTRSLIVYFSRSGELSDSADAASSATPNSNQAMDGSDTEAAAKMIQELTGADLYQIRTERYYRNAFWGTAATAWIENALNLRPDLAAHPENLDNYDVIYVGYPIWWFNAPMAIGSFLESYDLTGKTVVPFCTSTDNGIDISMDYIRGVSEGANVLEGYRVHNSSLEDVSAWLDRIGMLEDGYDDTEISQTESELEITDISPKESSFGYADGKVAGLTAVKESPMRKDWVNPAGKDMGNFIVSVDPKGELAFSSHSLAKKERPAAHVIEVLTEQASPEYLAYLQNLGISYLFAGEKALNCSLLSEKLYALFGIERLMVAGGGIMNWSFLQEGLINELSLVIAPIADGSTTAVSCFEKADFIPSHTPVAFRLKKAKPMDGNALWLRYKLL